MNLSTGCRVSLVMVRAQVAALVAVLCVPAGVRAQSGIGLGTIRGIAYDRDTTEPLEGVTVVVTGPALMTPAMEITQGGGYYEIGGLPPGLYTVDFYYLDATVQRDAVAVQADRVALVHVDLPQVWLISHGCWFGPPPMIDQRAEARYESSRGERPMAVPMPRPAPGLTYRVEGFGWGERGRGLPWSHIDDVEVRELGYSTEYGGALGPIADIALASGTNQHHGLAFVRSGGNASDGGIRVSGPIARDHAWYALGTTGWREAGTRGLATLARVDLAVTPDHQAWIAGLTDRAAREPATASLADRSHRDAASGVFAGWVSFFDDRKLELRARAGHSVDTQHWEPSTLPAGAIGIAAPQPIRARVDRTEATLIVRRRARAAGHHQTSAGVQGTSLRAHDHRRALEHRQLAAFVHDEWTPLPHITIDGGVRLERDRDTVALGRAGFAYDWTREGRARAFAHIGGYRAEPTLEDATARAFTASAAGAEYELHEDLVAGLAYERRADRDAVAVTARRRLRGLTGMLRYRVGQPDPITGARHDLLLDLRYAITRSLSLATTVQSTLPVAAELRYAFGKQYPVDLVLQQLGSRTQLGVSIAY